MVFLDLGFFWMLEPVFKRSGFFRLIDSHCASTYISTSSAFRRNLKNPESFNYLLIFFVLSESEVEKGHFLYFLMIAVVGISLDLFEDGHSLIHLVTC